MRGLLIRMCVTCGHYHGRLTNRCMEPRCDCNAAKGDA